jgi:nitrate reductase gamma subunit
MARGRRSDANALAWAILAVALLLALVFLGSGRLKWFDAVLVGYLVGTIFAAFGIVYRYVLWLRLPPTALMNKRGWQAFLTPGARVRNAAALPGLVFTRLAVQSFIKKRSTARWLAHQFVFWGTMLAAAVTFPLVFGWLHFESVGQDAARYQAFVANLGTLSFDAESFVGWTVFHLLDIAAILVIAGVLMFLWRRLRDPGALAVERSGDILAIAGLFAVSVTGLMLTASNVWLEGRFYPFLTTLHALTVIIGLLYIPFGKLFHIFQRPANLGAQYYKKAAAEGAQQICVDCGEGFASALQMSDLKDLLPQVGFDYTTESGGNYQDVCPRCRRSRVTRAQARLVDGFG